MKYYIESEIINQNFKLILTRDTMQYKLYSTNLQMDKFYLYAKFYDWKWKNVKKVMLSYRISKQSIKDIKIDKEFGFNSLDKIMIFEFPEDYPEEDLFYFVMKFNAKKII